MVFHEDIAFIPEAVADPEAVKVQMKQLVSAVGGALPAEHGHGTEYEAPPETAARWQAMDPTNSFNPGVGGLSRNQSYVNTKG
jgi:D-lactate dehydrogenase